MFRFENVHFLYYLAALPLLIFIFYFWTKWRFLVLNQAGNPKTIEKLLNNFSMTRIKIKTTLYILSLFFIIIGLANPQIGEKLQKVKSTGIDIIVAIDVSQSMLAEDVQPNRLERAKQLIYKIIENLKGDRIGLVVFAGGAYLQSPLTVDYSASSLMLKTLNTDMVPSQGTAIAQAIEVAMQAFDNNDKNAPKRSKALLIISDGENHEEEPIELAKNAAEQGISIYTMGIGTTAGAPVPVYINQQKAGYKQGNDGNAVLSQLNETMLIEIANNANGKYFHIVGVKNEVNDLLAEFNTLQKSDILQREFTDYESKFQYFIGIALLLLLLEALLPEQKIPKIQ